MSCDVLFFVGLLLLWVLVVVYTYVVCPLKRRARKRRYRKYFCRNRAHYEVRGSAFVKELYLN